jgi:flagellar biosynthetic protein FliR
VTLTLPPGVIVAFLLALVRASAWVAIAPPFSNKMIPSKVKVILAAAIALSVASKLSPQVPVTGLDTPSLIGAVALQVIVGLGLGFMTYLLFSAIQAAGGLIDLFGGFTIASAYDPFSNAQSSMFGRIYQLVSITLLFAIDGHILLVRGFLTSFDAVGTNGLAMNKVSDGMLHALTTFFVSAIEIAAPLLGALFLAEVVLGLLSRAVPQMNVFALGFPFKILLTILLAGLALPLLPDAVSNVLHDGIRAGGALFG